MARASSPTGGRVAGKVALVTGAGSGIGKSVAVRLAEEGADVVVTSKTPEHVEETCREVERATGGEPLSFPLDIADRAAVEEVVREVAGRRGRIDVLSNNAGIELPHGPSVVETTDEEWERLFRVNMTGIFWACRAAIPAMTHGGSIVNMASINSFVAWENDAPYTATKGALLQFTRALALETRATRDSRQLRLPGSHRYPAHGRVPRAGRRSRRLARRVLRRVPAQPPRHAPRSGELRPLPRLRRGLVRDWRGARGRWRHDRPLAGRGR